MDTVTRPNHALKRTRRERCGCSLRPVRRVAARGRAGYSSSGTMARQGAWGLGILTHRERAA